MTMSLLSSVDLLMLKLLLGIEAPEVPVLKLFTNNHYPKPEDDAGSYKEAQGYGYKSIPLVGSNWTFSAEDLKAVYSDITFTFKGRLGDIYGYYVVQQHSQLFLWAVRFDDGPYTIVNHGDQVKLQVSLSLHKQGV